MKHLMTILLLLVTIDLTVQEFSKLSAEPATKVAAEPVDVAEPSHAYMIQHVDGRWLRRTIPGQINVFIVDQGSASIWVNKPEVDRVWLNLGVFRDLAVVKRFILVPSEEN